MQAKPKSADERPASLEITTSADNVERYVLSGDWRNRGISHVLKDLMEAEQKAGQGKIEVDAAQVDAVDTSGAWLIRRLISAKQASGRDVELIGADGALADLIDAMPKDGPQRPSPEKDNRTLFQKVFEPAGRAVWSLGEDALAGMHILGSAVGGAQLKGGRGTGVSPASVVTHIDRMGVRAVPIIVLMSFLIGAIIAQQGAFQLRYFGAELFVVDLVGILQLREIGVLLTAIMIAGRSGSAITAEIGSMKMREEIDALTVIGLNPVGVLVFPRLVALTIALPLLTIIANFAALYGAAIVTFVYSGITFQTFLSRLHEAVDYSSLASGMIKAPFMALAIGIVSAVEGMKVGGSAESLGTHVTSSVVKSIFVVILMDALFAIFYSAIDF